MFSILEVVFLNLYEKWTRIVLVEQRSPKYELNNDLLALDLILKAKLLWKAGHKDASVFFLFLLFFFFKTRNRTSS